MRVVAIPDGLPPSDAEFWLRHRSAIIDALQAEGFRIVSTGAGVRLVQRCKRCGGALPVTGRHDRTGECVCAPANCPLCHGEGFMFNKPCDNESCDYFAKRGARESI